MLFEDVKKESPEVKTPEELLEEAKLEIKNFDIGAAMKELKKKKCLIEDDDEAMEKFYKICLNKYSVYKLTGQKRAASKVAAFVRVVEAERELVKHGIDTYIMKDDIDEFMKIMEENKCKDNVLLWDIEDYERDIPEDVIEKLESVKDLFDGFKILFTDYTGKVDKALAKEKKEKDPILFGIIKGRRDVIGTHFDRYYFIADWVDEFCDLTLDKMVDIMMKETGRDIEINFDTPETREAFNKAIEGGKLYVTLNNRELVWTQANVTSSSTNPVQFTLA